jgi:hypothetical protein
VEGIVIDEGDEDPEDISENSIDEEAAFGKLGLPIGFENAIRRGFESKGSGYSQKKMADRTRSDTLSKDMLENRKSRTRSRMMQQDKNRC